MCDADLNGIEAWSFDYDQSEDKFLVQAGKNELRVLAERWKKRLPTLLQGKYNSSEITVRFLLPKVFFDA